MDFSGSPMRDAVAELRNGTLGDEGCAWGENFAWEERVSEPRRHGYEQRMGMLPAADVDSVHAKRWVSNEVNVKDPGKEPSPFRPGNDSALVPVPDEKVILVRVEDLTGWARDRKVAPGELKAAFPDGTAFAQVFDHMEQGRDRRPIFAAFEHDLARFGDWRTRWHEKLPEILGLAHLQGSPNAPRVVALVEYPVSRVLMAPGPVPRESRFAAPTVLDHRLNSYFFPSPSPRRGPSISYGRAVNLRGAGTLVCEIIHRHIPFDIRDVKAVEIIDFELRGAAVGALRERHLAAIRALPECANFGEPA